MAFRDLDKVKLFNATAEQIWKDIVSGAAIANPTLLSRFLLISYADIKKYKFYFWFAFPALAFEQPIAAHPPKPISASFTAEQISDLKKIHEERSYPAFFLLKKDGDRLRLGLLSEWESFKNEKDVTVGFVDPSARPLHPGWPLRNFLMLIAKQWKLDKVKVVCYRDWSTFTGESTSITIDVVFPTGYRDSLGDNVPTAIGWEKNHQGKLAPKFVSLGQTLDPIRLAASSVDLNIKLMQWRLLPSLNLSKITSTRCLLLGAGTLGCSVARSLMAWGVRTITFLDNGQVSFSNPVRQSLYTFQDCLDGGKPKAETAAERLKLIFPDMVTSGKTMSIPMPGHPISKDQVDSVRADVDLLQQLVNDHDAVFILTDSRESRWLPTVMCAAQGKLLINCALGFDSYLVMRHGVSTPEEKSELGCYFCNDVVQPQDSQRDRTLDQQCTVTRPGLSAITGAMAAEILVSLLHHPKGMNAPAETAKDIASPSTPFGIIPHTIRGFLSQFNNVLVTGQAYDKCTACSKTVVEEYKKNGFNFLLQAFNTPSFLEDLTGLTEMKKEAEEIDWENAEEDDF
eukprot:TRINITY_DN7457_c0_g1_i3.p1 TRINITY_DN7457_c0_g1~~TRINITY_DN7457_c0_g1_i3.p1  ORF type:complete len:569 (-),score=161.84 TRINITY_DN7457_c0_g1_i3:54-1760(-)